MYPDFKFISFIRLNIFVYFAECPGACNPSRRAAQVPVSIVTVNHPRALSGQPRGPARLRVLGGSRRHSCPAARVQGLAVTASHLPVQGRHCRSIGSATPGRAAGVRELPLSPNLKDARPGRHAAGIVPPVPRALSAHTRRFIRRGAGLPSLCRLRVASSLEAGIVITACPVRTAPWKHRNEPTRHARVRECAGQLVSSSTPRPAAALP